MTPFQRGKSEVKKPYRFVFAINRSKTTPHEMVKELSEYGFREDIKYKPSESFDFAMRIRLEQHYNPSKFANDLIKRYSSKIMEIRLAET